jgi:hypothetical protein
MIDDDHGSLSSLLDGGDILETRNNSKKEVKDTTVVAQSIVAGIRARTGSTSVSAEDYSAMQLPSGHLTMTVSVSSCAYDLFTDTG